MESLLTLSIGEFQGVSLALRVIVVLTAMTSVLLALATGIVERNHRLPLILSAVGLGGASWFESGVWEGWRDAFELAGTSYAVTGHLLADQDRIIAWSLGVPAILFSFGLVQTAWEKSGGYRLEKLAVAALLLAFSMPFSMTAGIVMFCFTAILLGVPSRSHSGSVMGYLALASVTLGILLSAVGAHHSLGGGVSGELVRGEILRSAIEIFSLVIPALLLLGEVLGTSETD